MTFFLNYKSLKSTLKIGSEKNYRLIMPQTKQLDKHKNKNTNLVCLGKDLDIIRQKDTGKTLALP